MPKWGLLRHRLVRTVVDVDRLDTYLWAKIDRNGPGGCWDWQGGTSLGYGRVGCRNSLTLSGTDMVHRLTYELLRGPIPDGLHLDHLCRRPICCNPDHLEPVTPAENTARGLHGVLRTHCRAGHEATDENTYVRTSDNSRHCRICRAEDQARRRELGLGDQSRTHCANGHELVDDNVKWEGKLKACRSCARKAAREYAARKRADMKIQA